MSNKARTLTLEQVERMKQTGYEFDCENGIARYKSGRVVDTRGTDRKYICVGWNKTNKLFQDGDVSNPRLHRILYTIVNGEFEPELVIDHIDSSLNVNGLLNNSVSNLRLTTLAGNQRNTKSNTGYNFVTFHKSTNSYKLQLPINSRNQQICSLSANKFSLTDMQQIRNHLVHKHNISVDTCPPGQCWDLPTDDQLNAIVSKSNSPKLRRFLQ